MWNIFTKDCTVCGKRWSNNKQFLQDTEYVCDVSEFGLALRNCACGTTLGIEPEFLYPELADEYTKLWESDKKYWLVRKLRRRQ